MAAKQEIELEEIAQIDPSPSNDRSEPLEEQRLAKSKNYLS